MDSGRAASDWEGINSTIDKILTKNGAEVVSLNKWDERKLAYEIKGKARGTYLLTYFNSDPTWIAAMERDVQLSEDIMRVMILRTDRMSTEDIEKETPAMSVLKKQADAEAKAAAKAEAADNARQPETTTPVESEPEPEPEPKPESEPEPEPVVEADKAGTDAAEQSQESDEKASDADQTD